jgi:hypothetical protein
MERVHRSPVLHRQGQGGVVQHEVQGLHFPDRRLPPTSSHTRQCVRTMAPHPRWILIGVLWESEEIFSISLPPANTGPYICLLFDKGQGLEFQGHDPRKVECMTDSSASVLRLVIVLSLAVWMARSRWRGIVVLAVLRQRRLSYDVMKAWRGDSIRSEVLGCDTKVFSTRNQRAHARGSDACRCCNPWEAQPWLPSPRQGSM